VDAKKKGIAVEEDNKDVLANPNDPSIYIYAQIKFNVSQNLVMHIS
jgi:hypothetical protein